MSLAEIETLSRIARDAGALILEIYARGFQVGYKTPGDPVTDADHAANALICERLRAEFPDAAIVAEESSEEAYRGYRDRARVFFVDPLDGTREFVAKNGEFVVMIGLLEEQQVTLGVVYAPVSGTLWRGVPGQGAERIAADGSAEPIHVGSVEQPRAARFVVSRSRRAPALERALADLAPLSITPTGSAGLKGALVAEGRADVYLALGPAGKHWDACAMDAVVSAAGGLVTDGQGRRIDYRADSLDLDRGLIVANPSLHRALLHELGAR